MAILQSDMTTHCKKRELRTFALGILMLLSASCLQDPGYDRDDLDPYSARRNPHHNLLGFYVEDSKFIQSVYIQKFGDPSTKVDWFFSDIDGKDVLLVCACVQYHDGSLWLDKEGDSVGIGRIWLCLPLGNKYKKETIAVDYPNNEVRLWKDVYEQQEDETTLRHVYGKKVPIKSLLVYYSLITDDEINVYFTGEVDLDVLELDILNESRPVVISQGIIHLDLNRNYYGTHKQAYNTWLKYYDREKESNWPE